MGFCEDEMKFVGFTKKKLIVLCTAVAAAIFFGLFRWFSYLTVSSLPYTGVADNWSRDGGYTHISVYFAPETNPDPDTYKYLHYQIEEKIKADAIIPEGDDAAKKMTASSFMANGSISVESPSGNATLSAMGVWGDFFLFHDQKLLSGNYFSDRDINEDYVLLDKEAAWKLYGSADIAGKYLYIGNTPLIIRGVFEQPDDKLCETAGVKGMFCYVPYDFLVNNGSVDGISCYDIVMPNPVPDYAVQKLEKALGTDPEKIEYVENTGRFEMINSLKNLKGITTRAMRTKALVFPWWENVSRVKADTISVLDLISVIFAGYAALVLIVLVVILFIQNKDIIVYHIVTLFENIRDSIYRKLSERKQKTEMSDTSKKKLIARK